MSCVIINIKATNVATKKQQRQQSCRSVSFVAFDHRTRRNVKHRRCRTGVKYDRMLNAAAAAPDAFITSLSVSLLAFSFQNVLRVHLHSVENRREFLVK